MRHFPICETGDALVVWRLDRLGRSLKHLIETINLLEEQGIGFQSLQESIDTTTSGGRLIFHIFGALAEFERNLIRERTQAGLAGRHAPEEELAVGRNLWIRKNESGYTGSMMRKNIRFKRFASWWGYRNLRFMRICGNEKG